MSKDHFLPMSSGTGANRKETTPPRGNIDPIQETCSGVMMQSKGESSKFDIFFKVGLDQPMEVPHDTAMMFAVQKILNKINSSATVLIFTNDCNVILIKLSFFVSVAVYKRLRFNALKTGADPQELYETHEHTSICVSVIIGCY